MPLVSKPFSFACRGERLAWAGSSPDLGVVADAGEAQGVRPDPDAGEEVALGISSKFIWPDIFDAPLVYVAGRDVASGDQISQPFGGVFVVLVEVGGLLHATLRIGALAVYSFCWVPTVVIEKHLLSLSQ